MAQHTYEEPRDTFVVEPGGVDHDAPTNVIEVPLRDKPEAVVVSLQQEHARRLERRAAMHARLDEYLVGAPDILVRGADRTIEMIEEGSMHLEDLVRAYALFTSEYERLVAFTKTLFPRDVGLQAVSLDAVMAATRRRLSQIEQQWGTMLRRADGVGWKEGESSFERLAVHAGVLTEGIRNLQEVAERLNVDLKSELPTLSVETTEERFGASAK